MTDLTTTQNLPPKMPTMPALGPALSALLDEIGNPNASQREIAHTPALIAEARRVLPELRHAATAKAGDEGVRRVISKRFETYPQPQRTDEQWAAWWADYYDALSGVPLASLEAAMRAFVAMPDSEFMPKPGKLREMALRTPSKALARWQRAQAAVRIADQPPAPPHDPEAAAAMAEDVRKLLADAASKLVKPEPPKVRPNFAQVDETGISDAMRKLLAERAAR
jgi:hypothetical protein